MNSLLKFLFASLFFLLISIAASPRVLAATSAGSLIEVSAADGTSITSFKPFDDIGGMAGSVAVNDLGTDGTSEIIVGAAAGQKPLVRIFRQDGSKINEFYAYSEGFKGGVNLVVCDVNSDGTAEIVIGAGVGGGPHVRIFKGDGSLYGQFFADDSTIRNGVTVACSDVDGDKKKEIVTNSNPSTGTTLRIFNGIGTLESIKDSADVTVSVDGAADGVTATIKVLAKSIIVDISEQRLYAYENGVEVKSYLVSTAKRGYKTPTGQTTVLAKIPKMTYAWNYGPNNPNNYSLPNVKWNMRIFPHIYIHSAYWHHNFGHPMSHGCINTSIPDAEWTYNWVDVGTAVEVRQ